MTTLGYRAVDDAARRSLGDADTFGRDSDSTSRPGSDAPQAAAPRWSRQARAAQRGSLPLETHVRGSAFVDELAGIHGACRLDEKHLALLLGTRTVLDAAGDHAELSS